MESLENYLKRELQVTNLLKDKIKRNGQNKNVIRIDYPFFYNGQELRFDLVELDKNDKILNIYEVKSFHTIQRKINSITEQLKYYKKATKAKVFLAYLKADDRLQIDSLEDLIAKDRQAVAVQKTIENFTEFYDALKSECSDGNTELQYFFRGHSDKTFDPIPSIYRKNNIEKEDRLYHEAIRRNPAEFTEDMSTFDNLVKMQHYELPTRLLDITSNPLVALFFACQGDDNTDGAVLVYSILYNQVKYYDSDSVCILSNLVKRPIEFDFDEQKYYLIYDIQKDKPSFNGKYLENDAIHKVFCVLPKLNNNRIICQDGAFFIFGMGDSKDKPATLPDQPSKIIIKADSKKHILKELELLGIDEASLFPETDKVMKQIKLQFCD